MPRRRASQVVGADGTDCARVVTVIGRGCLFGQRRERALGRRTGARRELRGAAGGRHLEDCEVVVVGVVVVEVSLGDVLWTA